MAFSDTPQPSIEGRPPLWATPQDLEDAIDSYFAEFISQDADNKEIPTVSGLCLALGCCRETIWAYAKKPEFSNAIKKARSRLEMAWEKRLAGSNSTGAIFWLKNQGWKDTQTIAGDKENPLNVNHGLSESTQSLIDSITSR